MGKLKVIILVLLCCFLFSEINATPSSQPEKILVSDSLKYINLVLESKLIKSLGEWKVIEIETPFHSYYKGDSSWRSQLVFVNVILQGERNIGSESLVFNNSIIFRIFNDTIIDADTYLSKFNQLNKAIDLALLDSTVLFFIKTTKAYEAECFVGKVEFISKNKDLLRIPFEQGVKRFIWESKELIDSLSSYYNLSHILEQYKEFKSNLGIDAVEIAGNMIILRSVSNRLPRSENSNACFGMFTYRSKEFIAYTLPSFFQWKKMPYYNKIKQIVNESLLVDSLSECYMGGDRSGHTQISFSGMENRYSDGDTSTYARVFVALKCKQNGLGWKDAFMVLYPDSTFKDLKIKMDYQN